MRATGCHFFLRALVVALLCIPIARADVFQVPSTWSAPSFSDTRETRQEVAYTALAQLVQNVSSDGMSFNGLQKFQANAMVSYIATAELALGTTTWKDEITDILLRNSVDTPSGFSSSLPVTDVLLAWSIASLYAYRAYNDTRLLNLAEQGWANATVYFITEDQAAAQHHPLHNVSISSSCLGHTTAGGMFFDDDPKDTSVRPATLGQFAALSSHLAEETKNETYTKAAILSATFLRDILSDSTGVIHHGINLGDCSVDTSQREIDSGFAIHAWSVLADITHDDQWRDAALRTLSFSTTTPSWVNPHGIVFLRANADPTNDNDLGSKGQFVGALYEPWMRNKNNRTVTAYIESFLAVQYNALQTLATKAQSGFYNADWRGPAITSWTLGGVLASTPVLAIAAAPVAHDSASAPQTGTSTGSSQSGSSSRKISVAAIVGGIIGGLVVLALLALGCILLRRRRSRHRRVLRNETNEVFGSEFDKFPTPAQQSETKIPYVPRKHFGAGYAAPDSLLPVPQAQEAVLGRPAPSDTTPNVPVADIVELVYQRLQAERPPYPESNHATLRPPTDPDTGHQILDFHAILPAYRSDTGAPSTPQTQIFVKR